MGHQARAAAAVDDRPVQLRERLLLWQSGRIVTRSCRHRDSYLQSYDFLPPGRTARTIMF
jgi:hypothetical protein